MKARHGIELTDIVTFVPLEALEGAKAPVVIEQARASVSAPTLAALVKRQGAAVAAKLVSIAPKGESSIVVQARLPRSAVGSFLAEGMGWEPSVKVTVGLSLTKASLLRLDIVEVPMLPDKWVAGMLRSRLPRVPGMRLGKGTCIVEIDLPRVARYYAKVALPKPTQLMVSASGLSLRLG